MKTSTATCRLKIPPSDKVRAATRSLCTRFNDQKSIVKLSVHEDRSFQAKMGVKDPFVMERYYEEGSACIYLNEEFYLTVIRMAKDLGYDVNWNNTRTIGWLYEI